MIALLLFAGCSDIQFALQTSTARAAEPEDSGSPDSGSPDTGGVETGSGSDTGSGGDTGGAASGIYGAQQDVASDTPWIEYIRTADINSDGLLDVVFTGSSADGWSGGGDRPQTLTVAIQGTGGGFTQTDYPMTHTSGLRAPFEVGDLNGDGYADIVVGQVDGFSVYFGDGSGGLDVPVDYSDAWTSNLTLGDIDGDGDLDLALMNNDFEAAIYTNDGTGAFTEADRWSMPYLYGGDWDYSRLSLADMDGDGSEDLVALLPFQYIPLPIFSIYLNDGGGTFDHDGIVPTPPASAGAAYTMAIADFDGDGINDLLTTVDCSTAFSWSWDGTGLGTVKSWATTLSPFEEFDSADIDGDGDADLLVTDFFKMEVLLQDGGTLHSQGIGDFAGISSGAAASDLFTLGDMDNDGCKDIVAAHYPTGFAIVPLLCTPKGADSGGDDTATSIPGDTESSGGADTAPPPPGVKASGGCATGGEDTSILGALGALGLLLGRRRRS